jgi:hypothetical protein
MCSAPGIGSRDTTCVCFVNVNYLPDVCICEGRVRSPARLILDTTERISIKFGFGDLHPTFFPPRVRFCSVSVQYVH